MVCFCFLAMGEPSPLISSDTKLDRLPLRLEKLPKECMEQDARLNLGSLHTTRLTSLPASLRACKTAACGKFCKLIPLTETSLSPTWSFPSLAATPAAVILLTINSPSEEPSLATRVMPSPARGRFFSWNCMESSPGGQAESGDEAAGGEEGGEGSKGGGVEGGGGARKTGGVLGGREVGGEGEALGTEFGASGIEGISARGSSVESSREVGESNIPEISMMVDSGRGVFDCSTVWCTVTPGEVRARSSLSSSLWLAPSESAAATSSSAGGRDSGTSCKCAIVSSTLASLVAATYRRLTCKLQLIHRLHLLLQGNLTRVVV